MEVVFCRQFGLPFEQKRIDNVFCSPRCCLKYRRAVERERNPLPKFTVVCPECQKEFQTDDNRRRFCSSLCKKKSENRRSHQRKKTSVLEERKKHPRYCRECGKELPIESSLAKVFCDSKCQRKSKSQGRKLPELKPCDDCGKLFQPRDSRHRFCYDCTHKESDRVTPHCKGFTRIGARKIKKSGIGEVEKAARLAGMSYGKYQAMLYLQGANK